MTRTNASGHLALRDLQNLLHRAGWALSLAPQVVSAAEFAERDGWVTERGLSVHEGVNAYEALAQDLVREINAALGIDLTMASAVPEDDFESIKRLGRVGRAARPNPRGGQRGSPRRGSGAARRPRGRSR